MAIHGVLHGRAEKGDALTILGEGMLEEMTVATPVCVDGEIFLRTHDSLWCIQSQ